MAKAENASETKQITVAAVVTTYNRKRLLARCLDALLAQSRLPDEVIVVDNGCTDGTDELLAKAYPGVIHVRLGENVGTSGGVHHGIEYAHKRGHDWIWAMDDDAEADSEALGSLCRRIAEGVDRLGPTILYSCYVEKTKTRFSEPAPLVQGNTVIYQLRYDELPKNALLPGLGGPFLGILVPKLAVERVGLPNPRAFGGDYEYVGRLRRAGFGVYYDTNSLVFHPAHPMIPVDLPLGLLTRGAPVWQRNWVARKAPWWQYYTVRSMVQFGWLARNGEGLPAILKAYVRALVWSAVVTATAEEKLATGKAILWGLVDGFTGRTPLRYLP